MVRLVNFCGLISLVFAFLGQNGHAQSLKLVDDPDIAAYRTRFKSNLSDNQNQVSSLSTISSKQYVEPKLDITKKLNQSLDSVYVKNKQIKYGQGYRILVFSGMDKLMMNSVKQKVYKLFPDVELYTVFKQPEYRISFGDFIDKIQANNYLAKIRSSIPEALIVQDQVNIRVKKKL